jgi:hypothetical protein
MSIPAQVQTGAEIIEAVIAKGDLARLTPAERNAYYLEVCRTTGLNPITQPFAYIPLNGRLVLYAKRDAADQLRKNNGVSIEVVSHKVSDGVLTVHVKATDRSGRVDEDYGVVALPDVLKGEARANAFLKAVTKAKRRVTLSICGLGLPDESEVEDAPQYRSRPSHDPITGEVIENSAVGHAAVEQPAPSRPPPALPSESGAGDLSDVLKEHDALLDTAAQNGMESLRVAWDAVPVDLKPHLKAALDRRHKRTAHETDEARMQ